MLVRRELALAVCGLLIAAQRNATQWCGTMQYTYNSMVELAVARSGY